MTIYRFLLIIVVILWVVQWKFEFIIDKNTETGDWLLWYNWKKGRTYTIIFPHKENIW